MQSSRRRIRYLLARLFATPRRAALGAFFARPILRALCSSRLFPLAWRFVELTVNASRARLSGRTWFGAAIACNLAEMIENRIFYTGVWEPQTTRIFLQWLRPGDIAIDVGANVGYFTLLASRLVGDAGRVVAIEAWPEAIRLLNDNLKRNGAANVLMRPIAISDHAGQLTLHAGDAGNMGMTGIDRTPASTESLTVPCRRLIEIVDPAEFSAATLLKIDIEGAEAPALHDLLGLADRLPPRCAIIAEITPAHFAQSGSSLATLLADFAARGFALHIVANDYAFDADWWRFDPRLPPSITALCEIPAERFDMLLLRGGNLMRPASLPR